MLIGTRTVTSAVLRPVLVSGLLSEVFLKLVAFGGFQQRMSVGAMSTVIELTRA